MLEKLHGPNIWGLRSTAFVDAPAQMHQMPSDLWKQQLDAVHAWFSYLVLILGLYVCRFS